MSSTYHVICLSHDPALVADHDFRRHDDALAAIANRDTTSSHTGCDLIVGRWSGALIELTCPPQAGPARLDRWHGWHSHAPTIGVEWLALALAAAAHPELAEQLARVRRSHSCWNPKRLRRLARLLDVEVTA